VHEVDQLLHGPSGALLEVDLKHGTAPMRGQLVRRDDEMQQLLTIPLEYELVQRARFDAFRSGKRSELLAPLARR